MGFKTLREHSQKWTTVQKGQNFHLILDKCNTITAELLENETVKCHAQCSRDLKSDIKLDSVLKQKAKEKEEFNRNHSSATASRTFRYNNAP